MTNYVVTYDNGTGFHEWASSPQPDAESALAAANIDVSQLGCVQWGYTMCRVEGKQAIPCDTFVGCPYCGNVMSQADVECFACKVVPVVPKVYVEDKPDLSKWEGQPQFDQGGNYIG